MINLTPHTVTVRPVDGTGREFVYPPSGSVARVQMVETPDAPTHDGCPCVTVEYGVADFPPDLPLPPTSYIVSTMFADAFRRQHPLSQIALYVPDSGPTAVREGGQIVAVRRLIRK